MLACSNGKHIKSALLTVRKAGEDALEYADDQAGESGRQLARHRGFRRRRSPHRERQLQLREVHRQYQEQDDTGKAKGGKIAYGWDVQQNVKA